MLSHLPTGRRGVMAHLLERLTGGSPQPCWPLRGRQRRKNKYGALVFIIKAGNITVCPLGAGKI